MASKLHDFTLMDKRSYQDCLRWVHDYIEDKHAAAMTSKFATGIVTGKSSGPSPMEIGTLQPFSDDLLLEYWIKPGE